MSELSALLSARMGLHFPPERWADLERGVRGAARGLGFASARAYVRELLSAPLGVRQIETLAEHLTVGETYFLRDPKIFEALEKTILPELIKLRSREEKRLRIWSTACCTGEEAYTIAVTVAKLLPNPGEWSVTILATDLNVHFLSKAQAGVYTRWSFRNVPDEWKAHYFREVEPGRHAILPKYREMVSFSYLNLVEDSYPSLATNTRAMDLIFCRNVLMYFSKEQAAKVVAKLERSLVPGGWLVTSPSETSRETFASMKQVSFPGALFYQKKTLEVLSSPQPRAYPLAEVSPFWIDLEPPVPRPPEFVSSPAPALPVKASPDASAMVLLAREAADEGRLDAALDWCDKAIASDKMHASYHYLRGTIQEERGAGVEAGEAFGRALYLDPGFVLAHFALGNVQRRQGKAAEARKSFANALDLLAGSAPDALLPESTEITAGRLAEILRSLQRLES